MKLKEILRAEKEGIIEEWQNILFSSYLEGGLKFLTGKKNRFHNPVGHTLSRCLETIFESLLDSPDVDLVRKELDEVIHIRSVQDFSPSQAISFTFELKNIIRSHLFKFVEKKSDFDELTAFENRIDHLCLLAFDLYVACREKTFEIRANEVKRKYFKLLTRAGLIEPQE